MKTFKSNIETGEITDVDMTPEEVQFIIDYVPISVIPTSVTMRQARLALYQNSLLALVQASIDAIPDLQQKEAASIEWEFASTVDRNSNFVQTLAGSLGLTEVDLDNLFQLASSL